MTTSTPIATDAASTSADTQTFMVSYRMVVYNNVRVERPADITEEDLIASISKDDIVNGDCEVTWDDVKAAWQDNDISAIYDEDFNEVF